MQSRFRRAAFVLFLPCALAVLLAAETAAPPSVSSYAPAADVLGQFDACLEKLNESLESEDEYSEARQSRVVKDANLLIVLVQAAGTHDEENRLRKVAPALLPLVKKLADAGAEYGPTKEALDAVNEMAAEGAGTDGGEPLVWKQEARMSQLMKHVPSIRSRMKRGVRESRLASEAENTAGYATAMAIIAQATLVDTHEVKNPADEPKWREFSADMRDASADVARGARANDYEATTAAMERLGKSCDDCHEVFRKEEM